MVTDQINGQIASAAILTQMAVQSLFSKKAGNEFKKRIKRMVADG